MKCIDGWRFTSRKEKPTRIRRAAEINQRFPARAFLRTIPGLCFRAGSLLLLQEGDDVGTALWIIDLEEHFGARHERTGID
jgi:hypothetical protein